MIAAKKGGAKTTPALATFDTVNECEGEGEDIITISVTKNIFVQSLQVSKV